MPLSKREPTPADLYKLDKYWQMQGQLKQELQKLGDKQAALLSKEFENEWNSVYNSIALPSQDAFSTISPGAAHSAINTVWLADGKTFSQRIWSNTEKLMETLNDNLTHCVITGKSTTELTRLLQDRFDVSYRQAKTLVKTEAAHIQVQAAAQRYQDYGLTEYEFLGRDEHDIGCNCKKLNGKVFKYSEAKVGVNMPPLHPNCRCDIIPVINNESENDNMKEYDIKHGLNYSDEERKNKIMQEYGFEVREEVNTIMSNQRKKLEKKIDKAYKKGTWRAYDFYKLMDFLDNAKEIREEVMNKVLSTYIFCIDCGEIIQPVKGQAQNAVKRCPECQAKYRREYKAQKERERRAKKKLKK